MKISAIDVGSNSVRLALIADGKTLYKRHSTTRLGEGLANTGKLKAEAIERTAQAIAGFVGEARAENSTHLYVFATAAVRSSSNKQDFLNRVKELCGVDVDVVGGNEEARLGILGALRGKNGGIIDVGGASTEVTVQRNGKTLYTHSCDVGTVRLHDLAGRDFNKLYAATAEKVKEYGNFSAADFDMYAIGGTATTLAAVKQKLEVYDPAKTDGTVLFADEILNTARYVLSISVEECMKITGMEPRRADIIGGGFLLTYLVMRHFGIDKVTVSESDNLEGYVMLKEGNL